MRATNLMFRCPKEETPDPYSYNVDILIYQ